MIPPPALLPSSLNPKPKFPFPSHGHLSNISVDTYTSRPRCMYVPWQFAKNGMSSRVARPDQTDKLVPVGGGVVVVLVCGCGCGVQKAAYW